MLCTVVNMGSDLPVAGFKYDLHHGHLSRMFFGSGWALVKNGFVVPECLAGSCFLGRRSGGVAARGSVLQSRLAVPKGACQKTQCVVKVCNVVFRGVAFGESQA
jgi:hypothetical protein